jgi:hypothetical protein
VERTEDFAPGTRFGDLRIEREIGSGAFGRVWFAHDTKLDREVALKVLQQRGLGPTHPEDRARFLEEARIMSRFAHPHIAILYHLHETGEGGYALEMEHLTGGTLDDRLGEGERLPVDEAMSIARDVASALAAAHEAGVIHGDVKPANVLFTKDGRVKLVDFGLARLLNVQDLAASQKVIAGTPYYLAPEVIGGDAFKPASDVWSLGVVLYRMLAGRLPFPQASLLPLFLAIENEAPPPLGPDVPTGVARLVERCLVKRAGGRLPDGKALLAAIEDGTSPGRREAVVPAALPTTTAAVVGRESERAAASAALDRLAGGLGGVLVVTGPAGIGKTALVHAGLEEARRRGLGVISAAVSPVEGVLRPLLRALQPLAGSSPQAAVRSGRAGAAFAFERAVSAWATERPLIVALEDLHHASPEEVRGLARTVHHLAAAPVLWIVTERTSDLGLAGSQHVRAEPLVREGGGNRIDLGPLPAAAIVRILERETEEGTLAGAVLDRVVRRSGGNALFATQLLRHMRETGALVKEERQWVLAGPRAEAVAPPALRELVARRLQGLPESLRSLLDVAAVDGLEFDGLAVATVLERPLLTVLRQLQGLCRVQGLVAPREKGYRLAHPLLQEVVYREVAPDLRRTLHRALAEHLESRGSEVDPERLGVHWERSDEPARATPHLLRAAEGAAYRMENFRAVDLASRAGVLPLDRPADFVRSFAPSLFAIASALGDLGRHDEREALHAAMLRAAEAKNDDVLRMKVIARRGLLRVLGVGVKDGDEESLRQAAASLPESTDRGIALYALGILARVHGSNEEAKRLLLAADEQFVSHGEGARHGSVLDQLGTLESMAGHMESAARLHREAAEVCRLHGRLANAAISDVNAACAEIELGRLEGQADVLARAARLLDLDGLVSAAARVRVALGNVHFASGDLPAARRVVADARTAAERTGDLSALVEALSASSFLAAMEGDGGRARTDHASACALAERQRNPRVQAQLAADGAFLDALSGNPAAARAPALAAVEAASKSAEGGGVVGIAFSLSLATLHGLDPAVLERLLAGMRDRATAEATTSAWRSAVALAAAARAAVDRRADVGPLEEAARCLERDDVGLHRALLRIFALRFRREAARRTDDARGAREADVRLRTSLERLGIDRSVLGAGD